MTLKTQDDIEKLARGGKLLHDILEQVAERAIVGMSGRELTIFAETLIGKAGGKPAFKGYGTPPFPATLCVSINSCVVHGIPTDNIFKPGDIIGLDLGMVYEGLYTDMARTVVLPPVSSREQELVDVAYQALDEALALIKPGITVGDIGHAVQSFVEKHGFGVVRDLAGHGVGYQLHEDPEIPNFGTPRSGEKLTAGAVLAIEPMITLGSWEVMTADDGWSVVTKDGSKTAHVEDMIAITRSGCRILTR